MKKFVDSIWSLILIIIAILLVFAGTVSLGYQMGKAQAVNELQGFILINDNYDFAKGDVEYEYYKMKAKDRAEKIVVEKLLRGMKDEIKKDKEA